MVTHLVNGSIVSEINAMLIIVIGDVVLEFIYGIVTQYYHKVIITAIFKGLIEHQVDSVEVEQEDATVFVDTIGIVYPVWFVALTDVLASRFLLSFIYTKRKPMFL